MYILCICIPCFLQGIIFDFLLTNPDDLNKLHRDTDVVRDLSYVMDAITMTRQALNGQCPLFGFSGAPVGFMFGLFLLRDCLLVICAL